MVAKRAVMPANRLLGVIETQTEIVRLGSDLSGVMSLVAGRALELTHAIGAVVELAEGDDMVYRATAGIANPHLGLRIPRAHSLSGLCVEERHLLRCDDSESDPRVDIQACRRIGLRSMVTVPLRYHEQIVGVLKVLDDHPGAFDDEDVRVLGLMADLVAAAMFHAARHESGELFYRATHDPLTELPNRALFFERLRNLLAMAERSQHAFGVMNLDMDGLKPINDSLGHRAGDAAICEVGARIHSCARNADTVARLGGDEFGVILSQVDDRHGVDALAQRMADCINEPFEFERRPIQLRISIGVALYPDDGRTLEALLEAADQAMYTQKRSRRRKRRNGAH
ncbi:diguanylate cyclase domain-containing protein [Lysobacter tyrosinilyticus]